MLILTMHSNYLKVRKVSVLLQVLEDRKALNELAHLKFGSKSYLSSVNGTIKYNFSLEKTDSTGKKSTKPTS